MRIVFSLFLCFVGVLSVVLSPALFRVCIVSGFSWTFASLSAWFILFFCSLSMLFIAFRAKEKKVLHVVLASSLSLLLLIGNFILHPIYQGDYNKEGKKVAIRSNSLLSEVLKTNPNYDGLVCIASPTCPFCMEATETRLKVMKERDSSLQITVALFTSDSSQMQNFIQETSSENLTYFLSPDVEGTIELCHGAFPTFIYVKDKSVVQIWQNGELGYPALDWIENKLK